jgi:hypothetical protein
MRKNILAIMTAIIILVVASPSFAVSHYQDLPKDHWSYEAVIRMAEEGIIVGYPDGMFKPSNHVTYAEFIKMAVVATGDDPGVAIGGHHWAKNYYDKGVENGWYNVKDINEKDLPHPILRQYMALIVSKIINEEEKAVKGYGTILNSIKDVDINNPYEFEIVTAYSTGILSGYGDGTFKPKGVLTRAESASVIQRLIDKEAMILPDVGELEEASEAKTKLEIMKENAKKVIDFDPETDVRTDGIMKAEKSIEYMDKLVDTIRFTGNPGAYYMEADFPELPKGFRWVVFAHIKTKDNVPVNDDGFLGWTFATGDGTGGGIIERYRFEPSGSVKLHAEKGVRTINDIKHVTISIEIRGERHHWSRGYSYYITKEYYPIDESGDISSDQSFQIWDTTTDVMEDRIDEKYDYDIDRHFTWR